MNEITAESLLTSHQAGALLQVNPSSINKWVKEGRISAFRTPGGHRRIKAGDLVVFLSKHQMPIPPSLARAGKRRLLVVDDDAKQLASLQRLFKPYADQVDVKLVDNGVEALLLMGSFQPHLVVLDIFMPGMDGIEVCRRLKANPVTMDVGVILVSGQLTAELADKGREAGALFCADKPLGLELLLRELGVNVHVQVTQTAAL